MGTSVRQMLRNERGDISLVGVLIAGAILLTTILASMRLTSGLQNGSRKFKAQIAANRVADQISMVLSDANACRCSLSNCSGGPPGPDATSAAWVDIDGPAIKDGNDIDIVGLRQNDIVAEGLLRIAQLQIGGGRYQEFDPVNAPTQGSVELRVILKEQVNGADADDDIIRFVPVTATLGGPNDITACRRTPAGGITGCASPPGVPTGPLASATVSCPAGQFVYGYNYSLVAPSGGNLTISKTRTQISIARTIGTVNITNVTCCSEN